MPLNDFRSIYLPYCLMKQEDGSWVVLNREYKPVGFNTHDFIKYEDYPVATRFKGLGPTTLNKLSYTGFATGNTVFLYNDGCVPTHEAEYMTAYMKKLQLLAKLQVDTKTSRY